MCGRYQFSADEYKEIRQIVRDAQRNGGCPVFAADSKSSMPALKR